jgi:integrase
MALIRLKGILKVTAKGHTYWYAWRGPPLGPRLHGKPGSPEFIASYNEAVAQRRIPEPGKFRALVTLYRGSADYEKLAISTKRNWSAWLDRIAEYFGPLSIAQFDRPEKIRPIIRRWRNQYADTPRAADMALQVLSRVLSFGVELGKVAGNSCDGIKQLYTGNRAEIVWTEDNITALKRVCSPEMGYAVDLGAATGLRLGDLLRLSWSHIGENEIVISTGKSNHKRQAIIPLYDGLRDVLARIPKRATTVLTNSLGRPWTAGGFAASFHRTKIAAGIGDLHFHDLRGTAATRFYTAELPERVIAEILGWSEESVGKIIHRYVGRTAATRAIILQLNRRSDEHGK